MLNLLSARVQTLLRPTAALAAGLMLTACGPSEEDITKIVDARVEARLAAPPSPEQTEKQLADIKAALQADPAFATSIAQAGTADLHAMASCMTTNQTSFYPRGTHIYSGMVGVSALKKCAALAVQTPVTPPPPAP